LQVIYSVPSSNEGNNLDIFFRMIDSVEDDISEILDDENNQLSGYECLVICFNSLRLYCEQAGIELSQIKDHYNAVKEDKSDGTFWNFDLGINSENSNEVERFSRVLEEIENSLAAFEKRCKKTEELFDEWNCVFIMYSCLRKYCDKTKTNYAQLMSDVLKIRSDFKKNGNVGTGGINSLN